MSFLHIDSVLGAARPGGGELDVQSFLRRRAALIGVDRATGGKDAANWEGEGGLGERSALGAMTERLASFRWLLCSEIVKLRERTVLTLEETG